MYSCSAREKVPVSLVPSTSLSWQVGDQFAKIGRSSGTRYKSSNAAFLCLLNAHRLAFKVCAKPVSNLEVSCLSSFLEGTALCFFA